MLVQVPGFEIRIHMMLYFFGMRYDARLFVCCSGDFICRVGRGGRGQTNKKCVLENLTCERLVDSISNPNVQTNFFLRRTTAPKKKKRVKQARAIKDTTSGSFCFSGQNQISTRAAAPGEGDGSPENRKYWHYLLFSSPNKR